MEARLRFTETAQENAARLYEEAKRLREKAKGAEKAVADTEKKLREVEEKAERKALEPAAASVRVKREKEWFERFRWFVTSGGKICIAGRDARQNEVAVARHLEPGDLFFHADIHGAPATVLKGGASASQKEKEEAAQFAASYSSAWKLGSATVDVYAVKHDQVSKRTEAGEFAGKGGFIIRGEREWFRNTGLGLVLGIGGKGLECAPESRGKASLSPSITVRAGNLEKSAAAKKVVSLLSGKAAVDEVLQALPGGNTAIE